MDKLKVHIHNNQKRVKIPSGIRLLIRRVCSAVLVEENCTGDFEVSVTIVDSPGIREMNAKFRQKDQATDVLSFPLSETGTDFDQNPETGAQMLGDIVISIEKAVEQAHSFGHSLQREIGFLTAHSMLHLLGYDHEGDPLGTVRMREKEETVMTKLGLPADGSYVLKT